MTTKIATSFGLALMLAMGILATMLALGVFTPSEVRAIDTAPTMVASPTDAGVVSEYRFTFVVTGTLTSGVGIIKFTFDKDTQVPASISRSNVLISATRLSNSSPSNGIGVTGAGAVVPLEFDPVIETDTTDPARKVVTIKIPDMNPANTVDPGIGSQGIGVGFATTDNPNGGQASTTADAWHDTMSKVTVTFTTAAGIKNPSEQETSRARVLALDTTISTQSKSTNLVTGDAITSLVDDPNQILNVSQVIDSTLTLSSIDGGRGSTVTATGKGFNDKTTATVFLDSNADGVRDPGEIDLGSAVVGSDDTFAVTFTVTAPPFKAGKNKIGAVDGELRKITKKDSAGNLSLGAFILKGSVVVIPATAAVGDTIQLQLKDFDTGCEIKTTTASPTDEKCTGSSIGLGDYDKEPAITVGGIAFTTSKFSGTTKADATTGEATFTAEVPNAVAIGAQTMQIKGACCLKGGGESSTISAILTIGGAVLTLTPSTVVPNQTISVVGRSYTGGKKIGGTSTDDSQVEISGSTDRLKKKGDAIKDNVNEGNTISIDAGGNWSAPIVVPINSTTTTPGTHQFKVTDDSGREGVATLTIAPRTLTISPVSSRVGTTVTVTGAGFPSNNTKTGAAPVPSVKILYARSGATTADNVATATLDASGNFSTTFQVPLNASIPSTNTVRAEFDDEDKTPVVTSVVHDVPKAELTISPTSGASGTMATVTGVGFKGFSAVSELKLGDADVKPSPVPNTDDKGSFSASVLVPQLNLGVVTVTSKVGDTTASASFTVTAAAVAPPPAAPAAAVAPATALAPLGANLVRVWGYDAPTQKFQLYDPAAALLSDLTLLKQGQGYWVNVKAAQTATLGAGSYSLSAGWNLIGWLG